MSQELQLSNILVVQCYGCSVLCISVCARLFSSCADDALKSQNIGVQIMWCNSVFPAHTVFVRPLQVGDGVLYDCEAHYVRRPFKVLSTRRQGKTAERQHWPGHAAGSH